MKDGYFHCFNHYQQALIRSSRVTSGPYSRVSNRCFTNWEPTRKLQVELKRKAMTEAEAKAVITLTGHKCFLEEKYV